MRVVWLLVMGWSVAGLPLAAQVALCKECDAASQDAATVALAAGQSTTPVYVASLELYLDPGWKRAKQPKLMALDGQEAAIDVHATRTAVTGLRKSEARLVPIVSQFRTGYSATVTICTLDDRMAHVDVCLTYSQLAETQSGESPADVLSIKSPTATTRTWRVVRNVELGQVVEILDDRYGINRLVARVVVERAEANKGTAAPNVTFDATKHQAGTLQTRVYEVADLLPHFTVGIADEDLNAVDYNVVASQLSCDPDMDWPEGTSIRPIVDQRCLIVTQTVVGHERIAEILDSERTRNYEHWKTHAWRIQKHAVPLDLDESELHMR